MNIIQFLKTNIERTDIKLTSHYIGNNRVNNSGDALEYFVKDVFSNSLFSNEEERIINYNKSFSYLGNKNNPPDLILKNSDAVEIKKLEGKSSAIALNSSYPKNKFFANSPMITQACRDCEEWDVKDILYIIGHTIDNNIRTLWLIYGDCFVANKETYEKIKQKISQGIREIPDVEFTETNELGKVKKVDPLGVTDLRIRGMWHIDNPNKIFSYLNVYDDKCTFQIICLLTKEKFDSLPENDKKYIKELKIDGFIFKDVNIKDPNNPANLLQSVLISYKR